MKNSYIISLIIVPLFVITHCVCMEKTIFPGMQKMITIPCFDQTFQLERWKVQESISLYKHCLQYNKNFESIESAITIPKIPVKYEIMKLFSQALDIKPGKQFKEYFFKKLQEEQRRTLIIAVGLVDEKGKHQFNAPGLMASIFDVCFNEDFCNKHIKPLLEKSLWMESCYNKVINNNLTLPFLPTISFFEKIDQVMAHETGRLSTIPSCLAAKNSLYNGPYTSISKNIQDDVWKILRYKKVDNDWEHYITFSEAINSLNVPRDNKIVIWAINSNNKSVSKTVVEHIDTILRFFFSSNGEYVITQSKEDVFASKIIHQNDGTAIFNTYKVYHDEYIMNVRFDSQSNRFIICSSGYNYQGVVKLFDVAGACLSSADNIGVLDEAVLSPDGKRFLIFSAIGAKKYFSFYTVDDCIKHRKRLAIDDENNLLIDNIVCSPNSDFWAIATKDGGVMLIAAAGNQCEGVVLVKNSIINHNHGMNLLFSSDSRFLISSIGKDPKKSTIEVWSTNSGEKIVSLSSFVEESLSCGIGLTLHDRELVLLIDNKIICKNPFCYKEDDDILSHLFNLTTVYELSLLRRLCIAHQHKESIKLYEESPAYNALISLQKKPLDVADFVKKYLPWIVINNKKCAGQLLQETWNNIWSLKSL